MPSSAPNSRALKKYAYTIWPSARVIMMKNTPPTRIANTPATAASAAAHPTAATVAAGAGQPRNTVNDAVA